MNKSTISNQAKTANKIRNLVVAIALAATAASPAMAAKPSKEETKAGLIGAAVFTTASIAGAIAAGPVGLFAGALTGVYVGEKGIAEVKAKEELKETQTELVQMKSEAQVREQKIVKLEQATKAKLEFMVLFPTGEDQLSRQDINRLDSLATYMQNNAELRVRLDGHTDPRGTDEYNNVLSKERALSVVKALVERGIDPARIDYYSHGSSLSSAYTGDLEAYALERKVRIEVYAEQQNQEVAAY